MAVLPFENIRWAVASCIIESITLNLVLRSHFINSHFHPRITCEEKLPAITLINQILITKLNCKWDHSSNAYEIT